FRRAVETRAPPSRAQTCCIAVAPLSEEPDVIPLRWHARAGWRRRATLKFPSKGPCPARSNRPSLAPFPRLVCSDRGDDRNTNRGNQLAAVAARRDTLRKRVYGSGPL